MIKQNKTKRIIVVLAVLLACSLLALVGLLLYQKADKDRNPTATAPNNVITSEEEKKEEQDSLKGQDSEGKKDNTTEKEQETIVDNEEPIFLKLYQDQSMASQPFAVANMMPGDRKKKKYRIQVSYQDCVTVHFQVRVRKGYEKLGEVLKVQVCSPTTGEIVYDGLIRDMEDDVVTKLQSNNRTSESLDYRLTVYLETSVGNAYQDKKLIADFKWWVEDAENLTNAPLTGDDFRLWIGGFALALICLLLVLKHRKREAKNHG